MLSRFFVGMAIPFKPLGLEKPSENLIIGFTPRNVTGAQSEVQGWPWLDVEALLSSIYI